MKKSNQNSPESFTRIGKQPSLTTNVASARRATNFKTFINYREDWLSVDMEFNSEPSMTQPNEVMSIKELVSRYVKGLPLASGGSQFYDDPEGMDLSAWDKMDFAERHEYLQQHKARIADMERELKKQSKDSQPPQPPPENQPEPKQPPKADSAE